MRILYFGTYSEGEGYPRNGVIASGLEKAGATVFKCHRPVWSGTREKVGSVTSAKSLIPLALKYLIAWLGLTYDYLFKCPRHDVVVVGYSGHLDVFLAKALAALKGRPVVLDAFLSLYEAVIEDRALAGPTGLRGKLLKFIDRASSRAADLVLLDTDEHIKYYRESLGLSDAHFARVFVGGEENYFHPKPREKKGDSTELIFFGSFLPLHGADVIIKSIKILEDEKDLHFTIVGDGPEWEKCYKLAEGIMSERLTWIRRWAHYDELANMISDSDICLGIFGASSKAGRVIPCKVFNALAMGKPLVTADSTAAREALVHEENAYLVPANNPEALADAILKLKNAPELMRRISEGGLSTYRSRLSAEAIGAELLAELRARFMRK